MGAYNAGREKHKKVNPPWAFPKVPMVLWDMTREDEEPDNPVNINEREQKYEKSPYDLAVRVIKCRLLIEKYSAPKAISRCKDIHGTAFDGWFCSGRHFVFWELVL